EARMSREGLLSMAAIPGLFQRRAMLSPGMAHVKLARSVAALQLHAGRHVVKQGCCEYAGGRLLVNWTARRSDYSATQPSNLRRWRYQARTRPVALVDIGWGPFVTQQRCRRRSGL
ncbi:MAG: hypothetical protein ACXWKP_30830, partial [Bradyrhizobium sp.]